MKEHIEEFKSLMIIICDLTGKRMSETLFTIYTEALEPIGLEIVNQTLKKYILIGKFPSIVDIQKDLGVPTFEPLSSEEVARNDLTVLMEAARKDGWNNPQRAKERMGEKTWAYVQACGGWVTFLESIEGDNQPAIMAQLRESLKAFKHKENIVEYEKLYPAVTNLIEPRDVVKALKGIQ
jgi:hypothetical protein